MVNLPHNKCCGCAVCAAICPKKAINMLEDEYGYIYPDIDLNRCVNCNLCDKACPALHNYDSVQPLSVWAAVTKDINTLQTTASGGFATTLSEYVISQNGIVYGCAQISAIEYKHIRVDSLDKLALLKGSKYIQSDVCPAYGQARNDLNQGKFVLFTGTPCQIAGLKSFLRKDYDNLITLDLVCHGVPPLKMLKEQLLSYRELKKVSLDNVYVDFRWKVRSESHSEIHFGLRTAVRSEDGMIKVIREEDNMINPYMRCFQTGVSLRSSCLNCRYTRPERVSDFTAADFWGLGRHISSKMYDLNGVSLILVNSIKAQQYLKIISNKFYLEKRTLEEAKIFNRCLYAPYNVSIDRDLFLSNYKRYGLIKATKKIDKTHAHATMWIVQISQRNQILNTLFNKSLKILKRIRVIK
jgi:coenzyme F420-reducing hydrogenase beta subunit